LRPAFLVDWLGLGVPSPEELGLPAVAESFSEQSTVHVSATIGDRFGLPYTGDVWIEVSQESDGGYRSASRLAYVASGVLDAQLATYEIDESEPIAVAVWRGTLGASRTSVFASADDGNAFFREQRGVLRSGVYVLDFGRCVLAAPPELGTVLLTTEIATTHCQLLFLPRHAEPTEVLELGSRIEVAPGSPLLVHSWSTMDVWSVVGIAAGVRSDVALLERQGYCAVHVGDFASISGTLDTAAFPDRYVLVFIPAESYAPFVPTRLVGMPRYWEARKRALAHPQGQSYADGTFSSGRLEPLTNYVVEMWTTDSMKVGTPVHVTTIVTGSGPLSGLHIAAP
jgi:hypothetical protein